MKNEVFNGQRFWTYFKYDLTRMWRIHGRAALGIGFAGLIAYFAVVLFNLVFQHVWQGPGLAGRVAVFLLALLAFELYQTRTYGYLTDKRKGSAWLMTPASTFEKWLSMMIITLFVLPVLMLVVSFVADSILCLADPGLGKSILGMLSGGVRDINSQLVELNEEYLTNWNLGFFVLPFLLSFWFNLLFWLLCGLCFKRNKILGGFLIIFAISIVTSSFAGLRLFTQVQDYEDFAMAEGALRTLKNVLTAISAVLTCGMAGGIFYRLKSLKH